MTVRPTFACALGASVAVAASTASASTMSASMLAAPAPLAALPVDDWQFWVVSALALGAAALVVRPLLPKRGGKPDACPGCPSGDAAAKPPREKRVELTVGGKRMR
jgi:membrane protein implicated in regulation of membrane protease activity